MKAIAAILALCAPLAAHAVYKCQGPDGSVVYSDAPCAASAASLKVAGLPRKAQPERQQVALEEPEPIHFGNGPRARLASVVALLDNLALDGSECEEALKANGRLEVCAAFATHLSPGREWAQALNQLHGLLKEPGLFERHRTDFAKASQLVTRISGHSEFMERRLLSAQR